MNTSERLLIELIRDPGDECIEWSGAKSSNGYGKVSSGGKVVLATRYAKAHADGIEIPPRTTVCRHTCDNPPCVNPNHLLWGTMKDNSQDALDRDRVARGNKLPVAKMTEEKVVEARKHFLESKSLKKTRKKYGLGINACRQMLLGKTWSHVPNPIPRGTFEAIVRRGKGKWPEEEIDRLLSLRESGLSWAKIAADMGYASPMTPWRMYKEIESGSVSQD